MVWRVLLEEQLPQAFGEVVSPLGRAIRQENDEIVTAESHGIVFRARRGPDKVGKQNEQFVAEGVSPGVVDLFEIVHVDHDTHQIHRTQQNGAHEGFEVLLDKSPIA